MGVVDGKKFWLAFGSFFLLTLIPLLGRLAFVTCNKNDADVIPWMTFHLVSFFFLFFLCEIGDGGLCCHVLVVFLLFFSFFSCKHRHQTFWYGS